MIRPASAAEMSVIAHFKFPTALVVVAAAATAPRLPAQVSAFSYRPEIAASQTLYRYEKTDLNGGHAGIIALFVISPDTLESFKYSKGGQEFPLVRAIIDWSTFSIGQFDSYRVRANGERRQIAKLRFDPRSREVAVSIGTKTETVSIGYLPWHSFDFDFSSLNVAMRHLVSPKAKLTIGVADPSYRNEGPAFGYKGSVDVSYVADEKRDGRATRKYQIDGPGLDNRGGFLWIDATKGHLVELAVSVGDEPGYESVRLRFLDERPMTRDAWDLFVRAQFADSAR